MDRMEPLRLSLERFPLELGSHCPTRHQDQVEHEREPRSDALPIAQIGRREMAKSDLHNL